MATKVPLKFYKYTVNGQPSYDILPEYNTPSGSTKVTTPQEEPGTWCLL